MNTYRFQVLTIENGHRYKAQVIAQGAEIDKDKNLVFYKNGSQVAGFAAGHWVYYKRFEQFED